MQNVTEYLSILALGFCALLGMGALFSPKWAAGVVRLIADPDPSKPGGYSEFRATYGGLLFMLHATALVIMFGPKDEMFALMKLFAVLPIAMAWIGAAVGRSISLMLDKNHNRGAGIIPVWIATEAALGLAIASPILQLGAS